MKGTLTILFMQYFSFNIFVQLMAYWCRSVKKNSYDKTDYRKKCMIIINHLTKA